MSDHFLKYLIAVFWGRIIYRELIRFNAVRVETRIMHLCFQGSQCVQVIHHDFLSEEIGMPDPRLVLQNDLGPLTGDISTQDEGIYFIKCPGINELTPTFIRTMNIGYKEYFCGIFLFTEQDMLLEQT